MLKGILGRKIGMTQIFAEDGTVVPVTAIEAGPCFVTQVKTAASDGYEAVQLGFGKAKRLNRPQAGHLKGLEPLRHLKEFRVENASGHQVGEKIDVSIFNPGDLIDVTGTSKGRGFAGVVKRYHFRGGPKTHGQSDRQRAPGSIGATTTPGRVLKGKKMPGHMGAERVMVRGLRVVSADPERNILLVKGAVPGARNGLLIIKESIKAKRHGTRP